MTQNAAVDSFSFDVGQVLQRHGILLADVTPKFFDELKLACAEHYQPRIVRLLQELQDAQSQVVTLREQFVVVERENVQLQARADHEAEVNAKRGASRDYYYGLAQSLSSIVDVFRGLIPDARLVLSGHTKSHVEAAKKFAQMIVSLHDEKPEIVPPEKLEGDV